MYVFVCTCVCVLTNTRNKQGHLRQVYGTLVTCVFCLCILCIDVCVFVCVCVCVCVCVDVPYQTRQGTLVILCVYTDRHLNRQDCMKRAGMMHLATYRSYMCARVCTDRRLNRPKNVCARVCVLTNTLTDTAMKWQVWDASYL